MLLLLLFFFFSFSSGIQYIQQPGDNTLNKLLALQPGDTLNISAGTYTIDIQHPSFSNLVIKGLSGLPVTIQAFDSNIVYFTHTSTANYILNLNLTSVIFRGITFRSPGIYGIRILYANDVKFINCTFAGPGSSNFVGYGMQLSNIIGLTIEQSRFTDFVVGYGIYLANQRLPLENVLISNNVFINCETGVYIFPSFYVPGGSVMVRNNLMFSLAYGISLYVAVTTDPPPVVEVAGNYMYDISRCGVTGNVVGRFVNNVIAVTIASGRAFVLTSNGNSMFIYNTVYSTLGSTHVCISHTGTGSFRNNIIWCAIYLQSGQLTFTRNALLTTITNPQDPQASLDTTTSPNYFLNIGPEEVFYQIDAKPFDLHLLESFASAYRGASSPIMTDFECKSRSPVSPRIGAFENSYGWIPAPINYMPNFCNGECAPGYKKNLLLGPTFCSLNPPNYVFTNRNFGSDFDKISISTLLIEYGPGTKFNVETGPNLESKGDTLTYTPSLNQYGMQNIPYTLTNRYGEAAGNLSFGTVASNPLTFTTNPSLFSFAYDGKGHLSKICSSFTISTTGFQAVTIQGFRLNLLATFDESSNYFVNNSFPPTLCNFRWATTPNFPSYPVGVTNDPASVSWECTVDWAGYVPASASHLVNGNDVMYVITPLSGDPRDVFSGVVKLGTKLCP